MANSNILKYTTLMLGVVFLTAGSYLAIERGMEYRNAQERAQVEGLAYAQQQSQAVTDYIDAEMQSVTELGDWLARKMSTTDLDQESIWLIAEHAADRKPNVYGIAIALEPYVLPDTKLFGPYYHLSDDGTYVREDVSYEHDYTNIYDPRATWYTQVLEKKEF